MKSEFTMLPLFIVSLLAFFVPILASRIRCVRIPGVVLEILAGILIGRSVLNIVVPGEYLSFLSTFGFAFLMFLSGYEIDFSSINSGAILDRRFTIRKLMMNNLLVGTLVFLGTLLISWVVSLALHRYGLVRNVELMTLILSTTSVGVVVPTLKERGLLGNAFGQTLAVAALIADMATMTLLTAFVLFLRHGGTFSLSAFMELLLVPVLFAAVYLVYRVGRLLGRFRFFRFLFSELAHAASQLKVRGAIAVMLLFLVLSELLGTEIILGAFLAGAILSVFAPKTDSLLQMKLDAIGYGFFIPIFFIMVGVNFHFKTLTGSWEMIALTPLLLTTAFLNKLVPSLCLVSRFGWKKSQAAGLLLSARLSLIIAASAIGLKLGLISENVNSNVIIIAILTSILAPVLFNRLHAPSDLGNEKIIIVGAGKIGRALAHRLSLLRREVVLVDQDRDALTKARDLTLKCVLGDGSHPSVLRRAGADANDIVVAVTGRDECNLQICEISRRVFGVERTIGRDNNPANTELFLSRGVRPMNLVESAAITLENLVLRPEVFDLLADRQGGNTLREIHLKNEALHGKQLAEMPIIHHNMVILLLFRGADQFFPEPEFRLQLNDRLLIFGTSSALEKAECFLLASHQQPSD